MINEDNLKIEEIIYGLGLVSRHLDSVSHKLTEIAPEDFFDKLRKTIAKIDKPATPQQPPRSEIYLQQWHQFKQGNKTLLDKSALKYLCWESEIVEDPAFCMYIDSNAAEISTRAIKGLVSSIHSQWNKDSPNKKIVLFTADKISTYSGKDRTLTKWKSRVPILLGTSGPALFAKHMLLESFSEPKIAAEQWAIRENTRYMRYAVVNAVNQSIQNIAHNSRMRDYVLDTLLFWNGWNVNADGFQFTVKELILHPNVNLFEEKLRVKILSHHMLGDPRFPANKNKWLGIDKSAKQRFIAWLARRDIVFFFDYILKGKDPHGRRDFWLRYVDKIIDSRPLLSENTAFQIRGDQDVNFGRLSAGMNSAAFILRFGDIVVVEFSDVGKVYIYKNAEFEQKAVKDMWTNMPIREDRLKNRYLPDERKIRHQALKNIVNVDWRDKATSILAREGIRP
jgi:hypothetical protein